jgi:hypothetical protein
MGQRRLYEYFNYHSRPCPPPSGTSFLDLPPNIRRHIYDEAGLVSGCLINLLRRKTDRDRDPLEESSGSETSSRSAEVGDDDQFDWEGCPLWYNLLQTSRDIYTEVSSIIYSENRFMIHRRDGYDLRPLQNLSAKCLASLTCLIIWINVSSCDIREQCRRVTLHEACYSCKHEKPLGKSSCADKSIISEWRRTASRLAAYIQPSRLELYFACDTQDYETAKQVAEPILQMPTLKDCAIRLGREPNDDLQHLAEEVVLRVTGVSKICFCPQFRFMDLPKELQFRILEFSDLITPYEVEWWPRKGLHMARAIRNHTDYWEGCYLSGYHSAFSSKYRCWSPPSALFLVCWEMRRDAMEVFYSTNHFAILPRGGCYEPVEESPDRVETSLFLSQVPSYAMPYLRSIEIVFPLFEKDYLRSDEPGYQDWLNAIDYIARNANIPKLSITIYMSDVHKNTPVPFRWGLNREQKLTIMKMYGRTLRPLARLAGLRDLFVHLICPMDRQLWPASDQVSEFRARETRKMERKFEQLVMGDDYDSISRGKHRICSQWSMSEQQHGSIDEPWESLYV